MSTNIGLGLARVVVAAPHHRLEVALPEHVPLIELLPGLLRRAGDDLADTGQRHSGWVLRRADSSVLDPNRTLAAQNVLDGEVLYLVPRRTEWPEPEIDDLVDAIAVENRRQARPWSGHTTRAFGFASAGTFLLTLLLSLVALGPRWEATAVVMLGVAAALLLAATLFSRALGDAGAGAVLAHVAVAFATTGSAMAAAEGFGLSGLGAGELLAACGGLFAAGVLADLGVRHESPAFVAAVTVAVLGTVGIVLHLLGLSAAGAASVVAAVIVVFAPASPLIALRLGRLPTPSLPLSTKDLVRDEPLPTRSAIRARVVRSDQVLSGMVLATNAVLLVCQLVLVADGEFAAVLLVFLVAGSTLLRARLYPTLRHRMPPLVAGIGGAVLLAGPALSLGPATALPLLTTSLVAISATCVAAGLVYSRRPARPSLARWGDIAEFLLVVSIVPTACAVLGVFGYIRGLAG